MANANDSSFWCLWYDLVFDPVLNKTRRIVAEQVGKSASMLDVACGTGSQAVYLARITGAKITGIDISESMLDEAKKKLAGDNVQFILGNATKMPFENNVFDCSLISLALHEMNLTSRVETLKEMSRVTKKSMIIIDYTTHTQGIVGLFGSAGRWIIERIAGGAHYQNFRNFIQHGGIHGLLEENELKIQEEQRVYGGAVGIIKVRT